MLSLMLFGFGKDRSMFIAPGAVSWCVKEKITRIDAKWMERNGRRGGFREERSYFEGDVVANELIARSLDVAMIELFDPRYSHYQFYQRSSLREKDGIGG